MANAKKIKITGCIGLVGQEIEGIGYDYVLGLFEEKEHKSFSDYSAIEIKQKVSLYDIFKKAIEPNIMNVDGYKITYVIADKDEKITQAYIDENKVELDIEYIFLEYRQVNNTIIEYLMIDEYEFNTKVDFIKYLNKKLLISIEPF